MGLAQSGPGLGEQSKEVLNMFTTQINMVTKNRQMKGMKMVRRSRRWMPLLLVNSEKLFAFCFFNYVLNILF